MALIDLVHAACRRLAPLGWRSLLMEASRGDLDIDQPDAAALRKALLDPIVSIDRGLPGFDDYHLDGQRGIEPGAPARSLLYHALTSPHVVRDPGGNPLGGFPSVPEIEAVEDLVFGIEPPTLANLVRDHGGQLAVTVFAYEYRGAPDCVDGASADLAFSRTGIARVGTARPRYREETRGYWSEDEANPNGFRVIPVRFGAWLAAPVPGSRARVMRSADQVDGDDTKIFWTPIHKLFGGTECLAGLDLQLEPSARFFNLKLQRVFASLPAAELRVGFPFVVEEGLADLRKQSEFGGIAVVPTVQQALVEPATLLGAPLTFPVPAGENNRAFATYMTPTPMLADGQTEVHRFPAYVHARTRVDEGSFLDLNDLDDVGAAVAEGGFDALLYRDMTGEGWVRVDVPALTGASGVDRLSRPAYVLLAAPDFYPSAGQRELSRWAVSDRVPGSFRGRLWGRTPGALSDARFPANLQLPDHGFDAREDTMTAVVGMGKASAAPALVRVPDAVRASGLPDDAAGVFAPGWDVAVDVLGDLDTGTPHLAAYGLGSPFPEDAKLCAALSTFWPAVSPDVYRTMSPHTGNSAFRGTVAPMTDAEIGQIGTLPWDGIAGPIVITGDGESWVEFASFLHADYVRAAVENRFSLRLTARVTAEEYERRVLAAARVYWMLSPGADIRRTRRQWLLLSFRAVQPGDVDLQAAQADASHVLTGLVYAVQTCFVGSGDPSVPVASEPRRRRMPLQQPHSFFVSASDRWGLKRSQGDLRYARVTAE